MSNPVGLAAPHLFWPVVSSSNMPETPTLTFVNLLPHKSFSTQSTSAAYIDVPEKVIASLYYSLSDKQ